MPRLTEVDRAEIRADVDAGTYDGSNVERLLNDLDAFVKENEQLRRKLVGATMTLAAIAKARGGEVIIPHWAQASVQSTARLEIIDDPENLVTTYRLVGGVV